MLELLCCGPALDRLVVVAEKVLFGAGFSRLGVGASIDEVGKEGDRRCAAELTSVDAQPRLFVLL